ncbi:MAG TPA: tetratricopeptide repeat protein [Acidobacteriaceae bacterium]|nr:tetratricopeptide repeat protein [Acidobacteriaceae bacterium]
MRRVWLAACVVGLGVGVVCAQTPASQANEPQWKQTPEGRPAAPQTQMNCTGGATKGPDGKWTTTSNCGPAQDQPVPSNAAQQFPYPGDANAAKPAAANGQSAPNAPANSNAQQAPKSPAQQFPYPGDDAQGSSSSSSSGGAGDVKPAPPGGLQDAGSSGASSSSSSSSSSGYSSSGADQPVGSPNEDDEGVPTKTRASRRRTAEPVKTNSQQFAEDMQVASFYQNDGNFKGAYMRAKDAVSLDADDPDAHLALAEAARKLGKLDEAEQNYKRCLQLDPVPKTRKAAQAALKEMTGGG